MKILLKNKVEETGKKMELPSVYLHFLYTRKSIYYIFM